MPNLAHNWPVCLIVVALIASPVVAIRDAKHRDEAQTQKDIAACVRAVPRVAYNVAFQYAAAEARRTAGDRDVADGYDALADAGINTIPRPRGYSGDPKQLVEVEYRKTSTGLQARLTDNALRLQYSGCVDSRR